MLHKMNLRKIPFKQIENGVKNIELRLNDEKRKNLKIGDEIIFILENSEKKLTKKVKELIVKDKFSEIFLEKFRQKEAGFLENDDVDEQMEKYYSKQNIKKFGVVGIVLE
ncbi:RNA-binding protein [Candidatus Campbellbacteria bacterium]|nr:MAG: RNA-binding protein [Candidatus Campbellbacteria bacterium]